MVRTQIYLTERQRDELAGIAMTAGKKQSEVIREAVDRFIVVPVSAENADLKTLNEKHYPMLKGLRQAYTK